MRPKFREEMFLFFGGGQKGYLQTHLSDVTHDVWYAGLAWTFR